MVPLPMHQMLPAKVTIGVDVPEQARERDDILYIKKYSICDTLLSNFGICISASWFLNTTLRRVHNFVATTRKSMVLVAATCMSTWGDCIIWRAEMRTNVYDPSLSKNHRPLGELYQNYTLNSKHNLQAKRTSQKHKFGVDGLLSMSKRYCSYVKQI